jgi:hypothetical protein
MEGRKLDAGARAWPGVCNQVPSIKSNHRDTQRGRDLGGKVHVAGRVDVVGLRCGGVRVRGSVFYDFTEFNTPSTQENNYKLIVASINISRMGKVCSSHVMSILFLGRISNSDSPLN